MNKESKIYTYKIFESVYNEIKDGKKTIEFRLLNEKSENIKKGNLIKFNVVNDENKYIIVEVIDKLIYDNINDLWEDKNVISTNTLNYTKEEFIKIFYDIFGKENVEHSKIVGIKFILN